MSEPRTPTNKDLGRAIGRLRRARRLSLESLAGDSHMHPTYLSAIERGLRNPTWVKVCDLAQALGITVLSAAEFGHAGAVLGGHRWVGYERRSK
ncbi:MAG: helix-turn-helix transcriptional regulator [Solirubrobacteraceae bacterium]